jgi:class 3 adenylate cyclase
VAREQRKLAAIVAADVVGYSRLMGRDESGTLAVMKARQSLRLLTRIYNDGVRRQPQLIENALGLFAMLRSGSNLAHASQALAMPARN